MGQVIIAVMQSVNLLIAARLVLSAMEAVP